MQTEAQLSVAQRFRIAKARSLRWLTKFDESQHPRDEHGRWTDSGSSAGAASWPKEDDGTAGKGDEILVYRLAERDKLAGSNAGNAHGVATVLVRLDGGGPRYPSQEKSDTIYAYRVKLTEDTGPYARANFDADLSPEADRVGRMVEDSGSTDDKFISYFFPKDGSGFTHETLGSVPLAKVNEKLKEWGYSGADEAEDLKTAEAIRAVFADAKPAAGDERKRPQATKTAGASDAAFAKIEAAVAAIPASHAAKIAHVPVVLAESSDDFPSHIAAGGGASTVGLFGWTNDQPRIDVAETIKFGYTITSPGDPQPAQQTESSLPVRQPEQVTVHELAHAFDYVNDWKPSGDATLKQNFAAATKLMSEAETKNAHYWISGGQREMFAELYSAIYNPNRGADQTYFGGMTRSRVREVFAPAITNILQIKHLNIVVRSEAAPPSAGSTGWFVNEQGKLFALLNGMPYEVDVSGTPFDGATLVPGTYADDAALSASISAERSRQWRLACERSRALLARAEAHTDWMNECVPALMDMGKDQVVAIAACLNMWRDAWEETHPDGADDPGPDRPDKQLKALLARAWSEADHPRDPAGTSTGGQFTGGGGGAESAKKPKGKGKAKKEDFDKAKIVIESSQQDAFINNWNEKIGQDPAEFKKQFMGGLDGSMKIEISGSGTRISIDGKIEGSGNSAGQNIGSFTRSIDLDNKIAASQYFVIDRMERNSDVGKKMLAGNVATYEELGVEKVKVYANIDVGGYAWAKYGYVPEPSAWNELRGKLERELRGGSSSAPKSDNTMEAESWDMLSSDRQDDVRDRWMQYTQIEFLQSEQQNWRDSGQAKDDAKRELADDFTNYQVSTGDVPEWVTEALDGARKYREEHGQSPIPYTNKQLYDAVEMKYESRNGDGEDDPDIGFDDNMLKEPIGYDPNQQTLPGIEPIDPADYLTKDMRERIEKRLTAAFDKKAEENAQEIDPPSYLAESVGEYQEEYWDSMDDSQRLQHAIDFNMADIDIEPEEDEEPQMELPPPTQAEIDPLLVAVRSSDPKSIWKIADNPRGKELLLGESWNGVLNLKDPETMARFKAYVGKGLQRAA